MIAKVDESTQSGHRQAEATASTQLHAQAEGMRNNVQELFKLINKKA